MELSVRRGIWIPPRCVEEEFEFVEGEEEFGLVEEGEEFGFRRAV